MTIRPAARRDRYLFAVIDTAQSIKIASELITLLLHILTGLSLAIVEKSRN